MRERERKGRERKGGGEGGGGERCGEKEEREDTIAYTIKMMTNYVRYAQRNADNNRHNVQIHAYTLY